MLEEFARENFKTKSALRLSPATTNLATAKKWFAKVGGNLDGVIAKELNAPYVSGERTAAIKVKQIRSADCVVGGFRYASCARVLGSLCSAFMARMDCSITSDSRPHLKRTIVAPWRKNSRD